MQLGGSFLFSCKIFGELALEERVKKDLFPIVSLVLVSAETSQNEVFHWLADLQPSWENHLSGQYLLPVCFDGLFSEHPGYLSDNHLVDNHSQGPNIAFVAVTLLGKNLRGHVSRSADHCFQGSALLLVLLGETEVCDFQHIVFDEDIFWLQISVGNPMLSELPKAIEDLYQTL